MNRVGSWLECQCLPVNDSNTVHYGVPEKRAPFRRGFLLPLLKMRAQAEFSSLLRKPSRQAGRTQAILIDVVLVRKTVNDPGILVEA